VPQIYGTQFRSDNGQPFTQNPYSRELISDPIRKLMEFPLRPSNRSKWNVCSAWQDHKAAKGQPPVSGPAFG
jgi:hypothetical protein